MCGMEGESLEDVGGMTKFQVEAHRAMMLDKEF